MAETNKLTALKVSRIKTPGKHGDGLGLYLLLTPSGSRSWMFRYKLHGRSREMGLGATHAVPLADARLAAAECRKLLAAGRDPIEARNRERQASAVENAAANRPTFKECADRFLEAFEAEWSNRKHRAQWASTLETYAYPVIGRLPIDEIATEHVLRILEPIWRTKNETAGRVRNRIERVLNWAKTKGHRTGENPALWRGHLSNLLPRKSKVAPVKHFRALDHDDMPDFVSKLRKEKGSAARALQFAILTAMRTGSVRHAKWSGVDLDKRIWTVPGEHMKAVGSEPGKPFQVALSDRAVKLLKEIPRAGAYVFSGSQKGKPIGENAMLHVLAYLGFKGEATTHGLRATFKTWATEKTRHPREVIEMALAHDFGAAVEATYMRGDLLEKRFKLMNDWARHCYSAG